MFVGIFIILGMVLYVTLNLLRLKSQVNNYQRYWAGLIQQEQKTDSVTYIALGDSAAQSVGASSPLKGYVGLIAQKLSDQSGKPVNIINLSKSGAKVRDVTADQLPKLSEYKLGTDTIITLDIGANDMGDYRPEVFRSDIEDLFGKLPEQTIVSDIPYFGGGIYRGRDKNVLEANQILRKAAKQNNLRVADLYRATKLNDGLSRYSYDWFHPSDKGYQNWFKAFSDALK